MAGVRGQWGSRLGFILAAAGSAVGLGNIWKFPASAGTNGGGLFVLIYLACVAAVGLPVMIAEVLIGRRVQKSPVPAFSELGKQSGSSVPWSIVGWMGVVSGFLILSFYSVVAGWTLHYVYLAVTGQFTGTESQITQLFDVMVGDNASIGLSILWHGLFMLVTVGVVLGGIKKGVEKAAFFLMPALLLMLIGMVVYSATLPGFSKAVSFLFEPSLEGFKPSSVLDALGQAFFSLSLGMGALITYGSYLDKKTDLVGSSFSISLLDTAVALIAGLMLFPVVYTANIPPGKEEALAFITMPIAFSGLPGGGVIGIAFFVLLFFAALTSGISLLEVVTSTIVDQLGWGRKKTTAVFGGTIFVLGIPSILSLAGGLAFWTNAFGKNFFGSVIYLTQYWFLPLGALFISIFVGWFMPSRDVEEEFCRGSKWGKLYPLWRVMIRYFVPVAIVVVFIYSIGVIPKEWLGAK